MIRLATLSDVPMLLEMGDRFSKLADLAAHIGYDRDSMEATFTAMINNDHPVYVSETGAIGATMLPHPFNGAHISAQELFWWSEGRDGLRLLEALTAHCKTHCHSLTMITLEAVKPKATGRLYERLGFVPLEHSFVKVF